MMGLVITVVQITNSDKLIQFESFNINFRHISSSNILNIDSIINQMSTRKILPTLQQIITNHLDDVDYMALNLQSLVIEDVLKKTMPIHHKNFNLTSKMSTTKTQLLKTPPVLKQFKRSQSLKKPISSFNFSMPSSTKNIKKNQQYNSKTDANEETLCSPALSAKNKQPSSSKTNRKTLSRFLFQFQIPVCKTSPHKGTKTLAVPVDKIHTLQNNFLKHKNKSEISLRKTYLTQPLNVESKPISVESRKVKTIAAEQECCGRPRSCHIRTRRQKTQFNEYPWDLKPWAIRASRQL